MILLDTHVLIWLGEKSERLGPKAVAIVNSALRDDELVISAISFWETAMLMAKARLDLEGPVEVFRRTSLERGIREVAVDGAIGISAARLPKFHGDSADRIITASAMAIGALLLTADERILAWHGGLKTQDARR